MEYSHLGSDSTEVTASELNVLTWELLLLCSGELCGWLWRGVQLHPVSHLFVPFWEQFCVLIQVPVLGTTNQECVGTFEEQRFKFLLSCSHLLDLHFFSLLHPIQLIIFPSLFLDHIFYALKLNTYGLLCNGYRALSTWLIWCIKYFILIFAVLFLSYSVYFSFLLQDEKCRFIKHFSGCLKEDLLLW